MNRRNPAVLTGILAVLILSSGGQAQQWKSTSGSGEGGAKPGLVPVIEKQPDVTDVTPRIPPFRPFELYRPLGSENELLFSAGGTYREDQVKRFEIDTERPYAGGARSKAHLLTPDTDFAVHRNAVIGTVNMDERVPGGYTLAVGGKILAEEIQVKQIGNWADYVFDPDYRLKSLGEVEGFIRANRRLPDIPSAVEVKEKGISVGEMQSKLLLKVEELTLHLIEQQKHIALLQQRLSSLEQSQGHRLSGDPE